MIDILESVRRIISRWVDISSPLTSDILYNETLLKVSSAIRFRAGDEVAIHDGTNGEPGLKIKEVLDTNTIILEKPIKVSNGWKVSQKSVLSKTYNGQFIKGIYIGEPDVIPSYPAITILGQSRTSEWFTIGTTKERYTVQIVVYVESANHEESYRTVSAIANIIQLGLKKNIYPLIGPYDVVRTIADITGGDEFLKVANSNVFECNDKIVIENKYQAEELRVANIIDATTIQVFPNPYNSYKVADETKIIKLNRFIYNSWPSEVNFGFRFKGTLLHAASINWFAEEQEIQRRHGWSDPQLS